MGDLDRRKIKKCMHLQTITDLLTQQSYIYTDLAVSGILASGIKPAFQLVYNLKNKLSKKHKRPFPMSFTNGAANSIAQSARVFAAIRLGAFMLKLFNTGVLEKSRVKRSILASIVSSKNPKNLGRVTLIDKLFDFVIVTIIGAFLVEFVGADIGMGFRSLFAASGVGAIFFTLAANGIAQQIIGGLVVKGSDVFKKGDDGKFSSRIAKSNGLISRASSLTFSFSLKTKQFC
jgi:small-conductance mechanosensitive channel